jgi:cation transport regulator
MPYSSNADLPERVKGNLPEHAQSIYREAFNSGLEQTHNETRAHKIAWSAVETKYKKRGGRWVAKEG